MALVRYSDIDIDTGDVGNMFYRESVTYIPRYMVS